MSRLAFNLPFKQNRRSRADPSTLRSGATLEMGLVLNPTTTSFGFSQTTKRYPMILLGPSSIIEKKPFGRPNAERSIRTLGAGSGSGFASVLEKPHSRQAITTTFAVRVAFQYGPL